jgi:geranylgeranyl diphosphate synthase, type I
MTMNRATPAEFAAESDRLRTLVEPWLHRGGRLPLLRNTHLRDGSLAYQSGGGKRLRPILLLLCNAVCGGDEQDALPAAAAVELFHTWTLIHDDIIDRDEIRRGKPTAHKLIAEKSCKEMGLDVPTSVHYGLSLAILAGDAVHGAAVDLLTLVNADDNLKLALVRRMERALLPGLLDGEAEDVSLSLLPLEQVTEKQVLQMLYRKTALLMSYCAWAGAAIALGNPDLRNPWTMELRRAAGEAGMAFQLRDDILGVVADEKTLGKPIGSDLREGKRTILLLHAISNATPADRARLLELVGRPDLGLAGVMEATAIIERAGGLKRGMALADKYAHSAMARLERLPDNPARALLATWCAYVVGREY